MSKVDEGAFQDQFQVDLKQIGQQIQNKIMRAVEKRDVRVRLVKTLEKDGITMFQYDIVHQQSRDKLFVYEMEMDEYFVVMRYQGADDVEERGGNLDQMFRRIFADWRVRNGYHAMQEGVSRMREVSFGDRKAFGEMTDDSLMRVAGVDLRDDVEETLLREFAEKVSEPDLPEVDLWELRKPKVAVPDLPVSFRLLKGNSVDAVGKQLKEANDERLRKLAAAGDMAAAEELSRFTHRKGGEASMAIERLESQGFRSSRTRSGSVFLQKEFPSSLNQFHYNAMIEVLGDTGKFFLKRSDSTGSRVYTVKIRPFSNISQMLELANGIERDIKEDEASLSRPAW